MLSRMELGRGQAIRLGTWENVAKEVGLPLADILHTPFQSSAFDVQVRCHRLVAERAALGGWLGWTLVDLHDPAGTSTILHRQDEVAIVHVWDVIGDVGEAIETLWARIERERRERPSGVRIGGVVVIVSTGHNRRRITESAQAVVAGIEIFGTDWWAALANVRVPMPIEVGSIWIDAGLRRLRPRIPYVDCRTRRRLA